MIKLISVIALVAMSACSGGSHEQTKVSYNFALSFIPADSTH